MTNNQRSLGAILSFTSIFLNILIALAYTPFLIENLGVSEYGLLSIIGSFSIFMLLVDMGLNDSVIRYIIKFKDSKKELENFLAMSFILYSILGILVVISGLIILENIDSFFSSTLSIIELNLLSKMLIVIIFGSTFSVLTQPINAYIIANERFVFNALIRIGSHILTTASLVIILVNNFGVVGVVLVSTISNCIVIITKYLYAIFFLDMKIKLHSLDFTIFKELYLYSAPIFIVYIVDQVYWKLDNVLIGSNLGASFVAVFAIGVMFNKYYMSFATSISKVMIPKIIKTIDEGANSTDLNKIYIEISRIQAIVLLPVLLGLILFGKKFIFLWLGDEFIEAYYVMILVLVPYSLELIGNIRNVFLEVKSLFWYRAIIIFIISIVNIFFTIFLIKSVGFIGAAVSTSISILLGYISVQVVMVKKVHLDIAKYYRSVLSGIALSVIISGLIGILINQIEVLTWIGFLLKISCFLVVYLFVIWNIGLNLPEKNKFKKLFKLI